MSSSHGALVSVCRPGERGDAVKTQGAVTVKQPRMDLL
ncbi:MAG: hypothetical protein QOF13_1542 [Solirubrobacterales bacterium]|jgi:hypothetical protein|nr:hypothetical protein [Solirubrobacterales bacterium]